MGNPNTQIMVLQGEFVRSPGGCRFPTARKLDCQWGCNRGGHEEGILTSVLRQATIATWEFPKKGDPILVP